MDFITGEKFETIADFTYAPEHSLPEDYGKLSNTLNMFDLKNVNVVYTHTFYVQQLFKLIEKSDKTFIIITHNSDAKVDSSFLIPENVIKWYSQNVNTKHYKLESLPIGLENERWFKHLEKKSKMIEMLKVPKNIKNLVYMNHNVATNPEKRSILYEMFSKTPWVTADMMKNGKYFDQYLDNVYNHSFVICPEGNGMDTHRTWETLYMKSIPIEKRNINNQFYKDLPICFVNDWEELTEEFLLFELQRIQMTEWNLKKLTFEYWKNKIKNE